MEIPTKQELQIFRLSRTCLARVELTGQVTQEAIDKLLALLELSKDTFPHQEPVSLPTHYLESEPEDAIGATDVQ